MSGNSIPILVDTMPRRYIKVCTFGYNMLTCASTFSLQVLTSRPSCTVRHHVKADAFTKINAGHVTWPRRGALQHGGAMTPTPLSLTYCFLAYVKHSP